DLGKEVRPGLTHRRAGQVHPRLRQPDFLASLPRAHDRRFQTQRKCLRGCLCRHTCAAQKHRGEQQRSIPRAHGIPLSGLTCGCRRASPLLTRWYVARILHTGRYVCQGAPSIFGLTGRHCRLARHREVSVSEPTPNREQAPPERRRRLTPEVRRAQILAAALEVFTGLGCARETLLGVAHRGGVTKGALYHCFDSKDQLCTELARGYLGELVQAGDLRVAQNGAGLSREELLRAHLEAMWSTLQ